MVIDQSLDGKHVLMIFAHCDDELVCGWPILQNPKIKKSLIIVSSDRYNSDRQWCSHRKFVTIDICRSLDIDLTILDYNSEFYKLNHRDGSLAQVEKDILNAIDKYTFDYLFTHNLHGEYGHLDHKFISNLIFRHCDYPLIMSNITMDSDWTNKLPVASRYNRSFYTNQIGSFHLDSVFYKRVVDFYETRGVWTWAQQPSSTCNLYRL